MVIEEGPLASWLSRNLSSCVRRFIVAEPKHNSLIYKNPDKDDSIDIRSLATLYATGNLKEVYHTQDISRQIFKNIVLHYADTSTHVTQIKNKIKAHYLVCGLHIQGSSVYHSEKRYTYIRKVSSETDPMIFEELYTLLDTAENIKERIVKKITQKAAPFPIIAQFQQIPGVGIITAATFFAIVDTPWRFKTAKKLWKYNGLAVGRKKSNKKWLSREGLLPEGNKLLKDRILRAAMNACQSHNNPFARILARKLKQGATHAAAKNEVARKIVSIMWGMWKNGTEYDPALIA